MSYLDYYFNNTQFKLQEINTIVGKCYSMCPDEERKMRIKEKLVHHLEVCGDSQKLVKSYSRSAADSNMAKPHLLRPFTVLKETIKYLLFNITQRIGVSESSVYDFVDDRLRAVRQDMTIQRLGPQLCVQLLDPMVRFYVFYGYKLSDSPMNIFDPLLNNKSLLECLKWYLSCSDKMDGKSTSNMEDLISNITSVSLSNQSQLSHDRVTMEALYILCNLNDFNPIYRFLNLNKDFKRNTKLQLAYRIAIANLSNNFILATRLSISLEPICYCAFSIHLPHLQKQALNILSVGFNSKQLAVPCNVISNWLQFDSDQIVIQAFRHYGIKVAADKVQFCKADFKQDAALFIAKRIGDERLSKEFEEYFTKK